MFTLKARRPQTLAQKIGSHLERNKSTYLRGLQVVAGVLATVEANKAVKARGVGDTDQAMKKAFSAGRLCGIATMIQINK